MLDLFTSSSSVVTDAAPSAHSASSDVSETQRLALLDDGEELPPFVADAEVDMESLWDDNVPAPASAPAQMPNIISRMDAAVLTASTLTKVSSVSTPSTTSEAAVQRTSSATPSSLPSIKASSGDFRPQTISSASSSGSNSSNLDALQLQMLAASKAADHRSGLKASGKSRPSITSMLSRMASLESSSVPTSTAALVVDAEAPMASTSASSTPASFPFPFDPSRLPAKYVTECQVPRHCCNKLYVYVLMYACVQPFRVLNC